MALPDEHEDVAADFMHHGRDALPLLEAEGKRARLILGSAWGEHAPVRTFSEMFYVDVALDPGAAIPLPEEHEGRGVYVVAGDDEEFIPLPER